MQEMTMNLFKHEIIDRLGSFASDMPKYENDFKKLKDDFTIDNVLAWIRRVDRDNDFKNWHFCNIYNTYFDEIEEMIYIYN
jgi:hypothetical protein